MGCNASQIWQLSTAVSAEMVQGRQSSSIQCSTRPEQPHIILGSKKTTGSGSRMAERRRPLASAGPPATTTLIPAMITCVNACSSCCAIKVMLRFGYVVLRKYAKLGIGDLSQLQRHPTPPEHSASPSSQPLGVTRKCSIDTCYCMTCMMYRPVVHRNADTLLPSAGFGTCMQCQILSKV